MIRDLFERLLKGDREAVEACLLVFEWANTYDHLVDEDIPESERERALHRAMWLVAVELPRNEFYQSFLPELSVTMANAITTWKAATALQRAGDPHACRLAYRDRGQLRLAELGGDPDGREIGQQIQHLAGVKAHAGHCHFFHDRSPLRGAKGEGPYRTASAA